MKGRQSAGGGTWLRRRRSAEAAHGLEGTAMLRGAALLKAAVTGVKLRGGTCLVRGGAMLRVAAPGKWKVARAEINPFREGGTMFRAASYFFLGAAPD